MTVLGRSQKSTELEQCKGLLRNLALIENRRICALGRLMQKLQNIHTTADEKLAIAVWISQNKNAELLTEQYHNETAAVISFIYSVSDNDYMTKATGVEGKISAIWSGVNEVISFICAGFDLA